MVEGARGARRLNDVLSFFRELPWRFGHTRNPFLRSKVIASFNAFLQMGAVEWKPASALPAGSYDRLHLKEDDWERYTALLPTSAPGLADTFYVLRERGEDFAQQHIAGPFPFATMSPVTPEPFTPLPVQPALGLAFASPTTLGLGAGRSEGPAFGSILGLNPPSSGAPLAFA
jgi:hypothetical protein